MRPIARKLLHKIDDKGMSKDQIYEFFDRMSPAERKQSFPDDCLFQSDKYFAETVIKELMRGQLIKFEENKYIKPVRKEKEKE